MISILNVLNLENILRNDKAAHERPQTVWFSHAVREISQEEEIARKKGLEMGLVK